MATLSIRQAVLLYSRNRKRFYLNYYEEFRLIIAWLGIREEEAPKLPVLPWFHRSYELQELAKYLRTTEEYIHSILEEIYNEHRIK